MEKDDKDKVELMDGDKILSRQDQRLLHLFIEGIRLRLDQLEAELDEMGNT